MTNLGLVWPVCKKLYIISRIAKRCGSILRRKVDEDRMNLRQPKGLLALIDQEATDASLGVGDWARRNGKSRVYPAASYRGPAGDSPVRQIVTTLGIGTE